MLHPVETIIEALRASGGIVSLACQKLNIGRTTYYAYAKEHPELEIARNEIKEELLDLCEAGLLQLIRDRDRESIRFYLRCFGKQPGWIESWQVQGPGGGPLLIAQAPESSSPEELARIDEGLEGRI